MDISSLENWLSELPNNRKLKFISYLFTPIIFILEVLCWFKIWKKIVLPSLIETDEIFEFFSVNDFVYRKWFRLSKFEKIDIVPLDNQFYAEIKDSEKLRQAIRQEYINTFLDILEANSPLDLNNYINLQCAISYKSVTSGVPIQRIYKITIQYWRHSEIINALINTLIWCTLCASGYAGIFWLLIVL